MNEPIAVAPVIPKSTAEYAQNVEPVVTQQPVLIIYCLITLARLIHHLSQLAEQLIGPWMINGNLNAVFENNASLAYTADLCVITVLLGTGLFLAYGAIRSRPERIFAVAMISLIEGIVGCVLATIWPILIKQQLNLQNSGGNSAWQTYYLLNAGLTSLNYLCSAGIAFAFAYVLKAQLPRRLPKRDISLQVQPSTSC